MGKQTPEHYARMSALFKGRTFSSETIEKMRLAARRRKPRFRNLCAVSCKRCGIEFSVAPSLASRQKFCSAACRKKPAKNCERCNRPIKRRSDRQRFCSKKCSTEFMVGPNAAVWKNGISLRRSRSGSEANLLRKWSRSVFERDGFKCVDCRETNRLHAHHIKPYADFPEFRLDLDNGKTLCAGCHGLIHGKDFLKSGQRTCVDCGGKCSGKARQGAPRCRSCAMKKWHAKGRPNLVTHTRRW